jgi:hypothetical protein
MRARRGLCAALLIGAAIAGCTEISTDPQLPLSLQFDSLPALAVVVGDTLRGGDLLPAKIPVRAFSSSGQLLSDSALKLIGIDTLSVKAFGVIGGLRLIGKVENAAVRIVAQAGSLQSQTQTFAVVPRPTGIGNGDATPDSIVYDLTDSTARFRDVTAQLFHKGGDSAAIALNGLPIAFRVASFTATILDSVRLVSPTNGKSVTYALMTGDKATIRVKAYPKTGATGTGSIVVEARAAAFGTPVTSSPFALPITLKAFSR